MDKPRIFLGSSGEQEKLLQALTRGLEDVAHVEPWTTSCIVQRADNSTMLGEVLRGNGILGYPAFLIQNFVRDMVSRSFSYVLWASRARNVAAEAKVGRILLMPPTRVTNQVMWVPTLSVLLSAP